MSAVQNTFAFGLERDEERGVHQPIPKSAAIKRSDHVLYLDFLADMFPTPSPRKIDETESTSVNAYYIPGCEVPMHYSNTMKILHQPVYLDSGAII
jgi:hypothetical protein